jgi:hypothetical protein
MSLGADDEMYVSRPHRMPARPSQYLPYWPIYRHGVRSWLERVTRMHRPWPFAACRGNSSPAGPNLGLRTADWATCAKCQLSLRNRVARGVQHSPPDQDTFTFSSECDAPAILDVRRMRCIDGPAMADSVAPRELALLRLSTAELNPIASESRMNSCRGPMHARPVRVRKSNRRPPLVRPQFNFVRESVTWRSKHRTTVFHRALSVPYAAIT